MKSSQFSSRIKVGVVGARGYSGQELCRMLLQHSYVDLSSVFYNEGKSFSLWQQFPDLKRVGQKNGRPEPMGYDLVSFFKSPHSLDVVFLATPNEVSLELADQFLKNGISVIDLSGVFRLNQTDAVASQDLYLKHYGLAHTQPKCLAQAVYGLHPFNQSAIKSLGSANIFLVANPGCYVTSVLMAIVPLLCAGLLDEQSIIIDAKSGASGAGKKMSEGLLFSELYSDFYPYKVLNHQHVPEMEMYAQVFTQLKTKVIFTPHLLPTFRGILSTCYLGWAGQVQHMSLQEKQTRVHEAFSRAYQEYPLVEFGTMKEMGSKISLKAVAGAGYTHIGYEMNDANLIVFSALDNLLKGAASQAIENLNCIYGFPVRESIV